MNSPKVADLVPQRDAMCLLDEILSCDERSVVCRASSHRSPDNPLRCDGRLPSIAGIEYGAQAMAVHGALIAESQDEGRAIGDTAARGGYLVSVRSVSLSATQLDTVTGQLTVTAERVSGDANTVLYSFAVLDGLTPLLSGRAIVVLASPDPATGPVAPPTSA